MFRRPYPNTASPCDRPWPSPSCPPPWPTHHSSNSSSSNNRGGRGRGSRIEAEEEEGGERRSWGSDGCAPPKPVTDPGPGGWRLGALVRGKTRGSKNRPELLFRLTRNLHSTNSIISKTTPAPAFTSPLGRSHLQRRTAFTQLMQS